MKILHVEDDPAHAHLTQRHLHLLPIELIQVQNATDAIAWLAADAVDLLITDVALPGGIDGFALVNYLRETPSFQDLPVIFMSARDGMMAAAQAQALGALGYLVKPVHPEILLNLVQDVIRQTGRANPAK